MIRRTTIIVSAFFFAAAASALLLNPSPPIRRINSISLLRALNNEYDGRPSYRRYQRDGVENNKNRFNVRNSNYNNNNNNNNIINEDDAYELARELASRRGLHLSRDAEGPLNIPMDSYPDDYRSDASIYGSDYIGVLEQELPRVPMDYNDNNNYNEGYGTTVGGGGLKDLTWGGLKEQNDKKYKERYEVIAMKESQRRRRSSSRDSIGQRYKRPQPPRQPPREVRPSDFRSRDDRLYQSGPSSQRSQSSMGRRSEGRRLQQPRQPPKSRSNSNSVYPFEVKRINKLSELASTPSRIGSPIRRSMSQFPSPNASRPTIYQQPPPLRPPSTLSGFASTSEQMGAQMGWSGPATHQFMPPPPPPYVQMPQYQQQRRQPTSLRPPPSIPLSQLALQPNIQPVDLPSQQPPSYSGEFTQQQSQQMSGVYDDRRQQQQQQPQPPPSFAARRSPSELFGGNPSASFSPLPFQQQSQADFTRPFQGETQQNHHHQQQPNSFSNNSNPRAARQPPPDFNGPPPPFNQQGGPPPPFGQEPPFPPFGPDVHIFQNPFMNEPMFQETPHTSVQSKPKDDSVKVPKDPNMERTRKRAVSNSSSNNPGSGIKIPKDPLIERQRKQQSTTDDGTKVPKDPFMERKQLQMRKPDTSTRAKSNNQVVKVPKEPSSRNQQTERRPKEPTRIQQAERRPKEPTPKTSPSMRIPSPNDHKDKILKETQSNNVDSKGEDMSYEDFASFFDMPRL